MRGVTLDFSRPGKPTDNTFIESFNGKFRAECLNANWFLSLDEARRKCEAWRRDHNDVRPHSVISGKTPKELDSEAGNPGQTAAGLSWISRLSPVQRRGQGHGISKRCSTPARTFARAPSSATRATQPRPIEPPPERAASPR
jgi:putative transposase